MYEWDREKEIPAGLRDVMGFLYQRLPALLDLGAEMWPMEQATVYFRWARGLAHPYGDLIVVTYDASGGKGNSGRHKYGARKDSALVRNAL